MFVGIPMNTVVVDQQTQQLIYESDRIPVYDHDEFRNYVGVPVVTEERLVQMGQLQVPPISELNSSVGDRVDPPTRATSVTPDNLYTKDTRYGFVRVIWGINKCIVLGDVDTPIYDDMIDFDTCSNRTLLILQRKSTNLGTRVNILKAMCNRLADVYNASVTDWHRLIDTVIDPTAVLSEDDNRKYQYLYWRIPRLSAEYKRLLRKLNTANTNYGINCNTSSLVIQRLADRESTNVFSGSGTGVQQTVQAEWPSTKELDKINLFDHTLSTPSSEQVKEVIKLLKFIRSYDIDASPKFGTPETAIHIWNILKVKKWIKNYLQNVHKTYASCRDIFEEIRNVFLKNTEIVLDTEAEKIILYRDEFRGKKIVKSVRHDLI